MKPSTGDPVLLILDGLHTHCQNLKVINLAKLCADTVFTALLQPPLTISRQNLYGGIKSIL